MKRYIFSFLLSSTICATGPVFAMQDVDLEFTSNPVCFERQSNGHILITTDNNNWASYQAMSKKINVKPGDKLHVEYAVGVEDKGIMSFGWLNTRGDGWYPSNTLGEEPEVILPTGSYTSSFERVVPGNETKTFLVLRNYHLDSNGGAGQTTFTLKKLQMLLEPAVPVAVASSSSASASSSSDKRILPVTEGEKLFYDLSDPMELSDYDLLTLKIVKEVEYTKNQARAVDQRLNLLRAMQPQLEKVLTENTDHPHIEDGKIILSTAKELRIK